MASAADQSVNARLTSEQAVYERFKIGCARLDTSLYNTPSHDMNILPENETGKAFTEARGICARQSANAHGARIAHDRGTCLSSRRPASGRRSEI